MALSACVACAIGLAAPARADAQAGFSASCTPSTVDYPGSTTISCALTVTTGAVEERFTVSPQSPLFGGEGDDAELATLATSGEVTLVGPGALGLGSIATPTIASCGGTGPGFHGEVNGLGSRDVTIPASSQSQLLATFVATQPPWPGDSIAPFFEIGNQMVSGDTSTLPAPVTVRTAEPARTGTVGLRILFKTRPKSEAQPAKLTRTRPGRKIVVKGRTEPALSRKVLKLQTLGPITPRTRVRPVRKAVKTDRKGRFTTSFTPESRGRYEVAMAFTSRSPVRADGYTCARAFQVKK